jgi:hypothetical protein
MPQEIDNDKPEKKPGTPPPIAAETAANETVISLPAEQLDQYAFGNNPLNLNLLDIALGETQPAAIVQEQNNLADATNSLRIAFPRLPSDTAKLLVEQNAVNIPWKRVALKEAYFNAYNYTNDIFNNTRFWNSFNSLCQEGQEAVLQKHGSTREIVAQYYGRSLDEKSQKLLASAIKDSAGPNTADKRYESARGIQTRAFIDALKYLTGGDESFASVDESSYAPQAALRLAHTFGNDWHKWIDFHEKQKLAELKTNNPDLLTLSDAEIKVQHAIEFAELHKAITSWLPATQAGTELAPWLLRFADRNMVQLSRVASCWNELSAQDRKLSYKRLVNKVTPQMYEVEANPNGFALKNKDLGVVGSVAFTDNEHYIYGLNVSHPHRGQSIQLLNALMQHIEKEGGEWTAHCRESTSYTLLKACEKRGSIKILEERLDGPVNSETVYFIRFRPTTQEEKANILARAGSNSQITPLSLAEPAPITELPVTTEISTTAADAILPDSLTPDGELSKIKIDENPKPPKNIAEDNIEHEADSKKLAAELAAELERNASAEAPNNSPKHISHTGRTFAIFLGLSFALQKLKREIAPESNENVPYDIY